MTTKGLWFAVGFSAVLALPGSVLAGDARLADAAQRRDMAAVRVLLAQRVDVNAPQPDGATALTWAAHWNDLDLADLLIKAGAKVNAANELAVTPLMLAAVNGSVPMADKLLVAGADAKFARPSGETALIFAARSGSAGVIKTLVAHGADVQARTKAGDTALMFAAGEKHPEAVRTLIEGGADIHARAEFTKPAARGGMRRQSAEDTSKSGGTALPKPKKAEEFQLLYKGQAVAIAQIPRDGDNDPPRVEGGFTPLLHAALAGSLDVVKLLVEAGAKVNDTAPDGLSALQVAIIKHNEDVALYLVDKGAELNTTEAGFAALHAAAATGQMAIATSLLKHGADPNIRVTMPLRLSSAFVPYNPELVTGRLSQIGATPFMVAAKAVNAKMMRLLLDNGADPLKKADDGTTALILAAGLGKRSQTDMFAFIRYYTWDEARAIETIKMCLDLGIDINAANEFGESALHGATYHAAHQVIQFLVSKGANMNAANWSGQTPYRLAMGHFYSGTFVRYVETAALLQKLGADPNAGVQLNFGLTGYDSDKGAAGAVKSAGTTERK